MANHVTRRWAQARWGLTSFHIGAKRRDRRDHLDDLSETSSCIEVILGWTLGSKTDFWNSLIDHQQCTTSELRLGIDTKYRIFPHHPASLTPLFSPMFFNGGANLKAWWMRRRWPAVTTRRLPGSAHAWATCPSSTWNAPGSSRRTSTLISNPFKKRDCKGPPPNDQITQKSRFVGDLYNYIWLVVGPPLWKIWVRQLGWFEIPNISGKCQKWQPNHQPDMLISSFTDHRFIILSRHRLVINWSCWFLES